MEKTTERGTPLLTDEDILEFEQRLQEAQVGGFQDRFRDDEEGLLIQTQPSGANTLLGTVKVPDISPKALFDALLYADVVNGYDDMRERFDIVEKFDETRDITFYQSKPPLRFVVSARSFLTTRIHKRVRPDEDTYIILFKSVESHPDVEESRGVVRGWTHFTCFYLDPYPDVPNCSRLRYLTNSEVRGRIPMFFVNFMLVKFAPGFARQLVAFAQETYRTQPEGVFSESDGEGD